MAPFEDEPVEATRNQLLASLAPVDRDHLLRDLSPVRFTTRDLLILQGEPVRRAYFPTGGMYALQVAVGNGRAAATSAVGSEGFVGVTAILGGYFSPVEAQCLASGTALSIEVTALRGHVAERPAFLDALLGYTNTLLAQTQRNVACSRLHGLEARFARWLLMTQDRLQTTDLPLTQELMGTLLGVRRASVSKAAETLQGLGLINYHRGHLTIRHRRGLEARSCDCYRELRLPEMRTK